MVPSASVAQELALEAILGADGWGRPHRELRGDADVTAFLADCFDASRTANGVGGWKLMYSHVQQLARRTDDGRPQRVLELLPDDCRFVFLRRHDTMAQAVSAARAINTQCWNAAAQAEFRGVEIFDPHLALDRRRVIERSNEQWSTLLAPMGDRSIELTYESVVADPDAIVATIHRHLDVPGPGAPAGGSGTDGAGGRAGAGGDRAKSAPRFTRQSNRRSERYRRRAERLARASSPRRRVDRLIRTPTRTLGRVLAERRFHRRVDREWVD